MVNVGKSVVLFLGRNHMMFLFQRPSFGLRLYFGYPSLMAFDHE